MRAKVELCDFTSTSVDTVVNVQLRDQLITSIRSNDVRKELMKYSKLIVADAVAKAVALETSIAESSMYEHGPLDLPSPISMIKVSLPSLGNQGKLLKCKYCGRLHMRGKQHFAAVCLQKRKAPVAQVVEYETQMSSKRAEPLYHVYETLYSQSFFKG